VKASPASAPPARRTPTANAEGRRQHPVNKVPMLIHQPSLRRRRPGPSDPSPYVPKARIRRTLGAEHAHENDDSAIGKDREHRAAGRSRCSPGSTGENSASTSSFARLRVLPRSVRPAREQDQKTQRQSTCGRRTGDPPGRARLRTAPTDPVFVPANRFKRIVGPAAATSSSSACRRRGPWRWR
jgi:hypothetical protein